MPTPPLGQTAVTFHCLDGLLSTGRSPHSIVPSAAVIPSDWTKDGTSPAEQENTVADDSGRIGMSMLRFGCALFALAVIACAAHGAQAEVTRVEIASRTDVLGGGKTFGDTGAYEKIIGKVWFSVDPRH